MESELSRLQRQQASDDNYIARPEPNAVSLNTKVGKAFADNPSHELELLDFVESDGEGSGFTQALRLPKWKRAAPPMQRIPSPEDAWRYYEFAQHMMERQFRAGKGKRPAFDKEALGNVLASLEVRGVPRIVLEVITGRSQQGVSDLLSAHHTRRETVPPRRSNVYLNDEGRWVNVYIDKYGRWWLPTQYWKKPKPVKLRLHPATGIRTADDPAWQKYEIGCECPPATETWRDAKTLTTRCSRCYRLKRISAHSASRSNGASDEPSVMTSALAPLPDSDSMRSKSDRDKQPVSDGHRATSQLRHPARASRRTLSVRVSDRPGSALATRA